VFSVFPFFPQGNAPLKRRHKSGGAGLEAFFIRKPF